MFVQVPVEVEVEVGAGAGTGTGCPSRSESAAASELTLGRAPRVDPEHPICSPSPTYTGLPPNTFGFAPQLLLFLSHPLTPTSSTIA